MLMQRTHKRSRTEALASSDPAHHGNDDQRIHPSHLSSSADRNFRNLSTCNRCRMRKNRCDQRLPQCANCEKVDASCVGFDPVTKKEIPRSYVYYLEGRVAALAGILDEHGIAYPDANASTLSQSTCSSRVVKSGSIIAAQPTEHAPHERVDNLLGSSGMHQVSNSAGMNHNPGLGSSVSFARLVASSAGSSVAASSEVPRIAMTDGRFQAASDCAKTIPLPDRRLGSRLISLYIQNSNSMYPVLESDKLEELAEKAYESQSLNSAEQYILRMICAIGAGIYLTGGIDESADALKDEINDGNIEHEPEDYHASAMIHFDTFFIANVERRDETALDELQAVLLLAAYALLRPTAPGLWYIVGIAVRRALDLGLHNEAITAPLDSHTQVEQDEDKRQLKRRLWWCAYSFDRLISTCVARPCNVPDDVITTDFPSLSTDVGVPSSDPTTANPQTYGYKDVAHHYFRLRILQSEILQVMQSVQSQYDRDHSANKYYHANKRSPFSLRLNDIDSWRRDVDGRLRDWVDSAPLESVAGATFVPEFFELNYWQTIVMLYRQSIFISPATRKSSDSDAQPDEPSESDDLYLVLCEASRNVLRLYRELHLMHLVNYTFLDTHQIFSAANAYLFAVWNSPVVRQKVSLSEIDLHVLMATSVLDDLVDKCPHAAACRDTLWQTSKSTIRKFRSNLPHSSYKPRLRRVVETHSVAKHRKPINTQMREADLITINTSADFTTGSRIVAVHSAADGCRSYDCDRLEPLSSALAETPKANTATAPVQGESSGSSAGSAQLSDPMWNFDVNFGSNTSMNMFGSFFFNGWSERGKGM